MERTDDRSGRRVRAIRVYTLCQESRYLIVRNVPALGCIDELVKLFALYGPIEEYRLMDEEDCEEFTDVYWIKFAHISNARFAKRKLDEYQFLGNLLQVSYAPNHETLADTHNKLEERRRTVLNRLNSGNHKDQGIHCLVPLGKTIDQLSNPLHHHLSNYTLQCRRKHSEETNSSTVSSLVGNMHGTEPAMKKQRQDNRRRI
ncbi:unnamed protein product [Sphagnum troendelagicum]|uniref:RNA-binding protein 48 n=1 Tax=Sphagnum troendelagicum TaxID=128251 RepID=A0ABP0UZ69_9BRYO